MAPDRAKQIIEQAKATAGCGPWSDQLRKIMTIGEREFVKRVWHQMPGHTCFVDALLRIANDRIVQNNG
jgi:hypothetical protein